MRYGGELDIAIGLSRMSKAWKNTKMMWSEMVEKLTTEHRTAETLAQFLAAPKEEQDRIKDVGGYVGGYLRNGRRSPDAVMFRQVITLDLDFATLDFWFDFTIQYECAAVLHATHKHSVKTPRYRLIIPLDREVSPIEYLAISRRIAGNLNIDLFDNTSFETNRLMYWPSNPKDIEFYYEVQDGEWLSADAVLDTYVDWKDASAWPTSQSVSEHIRGEIKKQEDPEAKRGVIGLFCRTYDIHDAIETFLPEVYTKIMPNRYTYLNGTTAGGLITYEDKFAYSHHGTDPASGQLCNAFDLVRLHKFGHLDKGNDKTSMRHMEQLVVDDKAVKHTIAAERRAEVSDDFAEGLEELDMSDDKWIEQLKANNKGEYENSAQNINIILQNDPYIKGNFMLNAFDGKRYLLKNVPWRKVKGTEPIRDVDYSGVRNYIETVYGIVASSKIDDALALEFERRAFHPVREYLNGLEWDGRPRIDMLLVDFFGAEDNAYTRAAIRKMLTGAVARVMEPGIKFDLVLIIVGPQGCYKSTFIRRLGKRWFSDSFNTVQGKEAFEQLQGAWIIEMAELSGLRKAEVESIKHFISKCDDTFRPAYGRTTETYKRQCVFFGSTNVGDFLKDPTGNRRFMPIATAPENALLSVPDDMTDETVDQIWAEAVELYRAGERLYLSAEEESLARGEQRRHSEVDDRRGLIEEYLELLLPPDWSSYDLPKRRDWLADPLSARGTVPRETVTIAELWCECLGKDKVDMSRYSTRDVNDMMKSLHNWHFTNTTKRFEIYGTQKYFQRKKD